MDFEGTVQFAMLYAITHNTYSRYYNFCEVG